MRFIMRFINCADLLILVLIANSQDIYVIWAFNEARKLVMTLWNQGRISTAKGVIDALGTTEIFYFYD